MDDLDHEIWLRKREAHKAGYFSASLGKSINQSASYKDRAFRNSWEDGWFYSYRLQEHFEKQRLKNE